MTLLDELAVGSVIGIDTAPFIYFIEAHTRYLPIVQPLFEDRLQNGLNQGITSTVSLAESLVRPLAQGRTDLVDRYRVLLTSTPHLTLLDITQAVAERAADLRARYNLRLPDAFQVAVALERNASSLVTNDQALRRVTELKVLVLDDYVPPTGP